MQTVNSISEAKQFFLRNSQDGEKGQPKQSAVKCRKDSRWRICHSLDEAAAWYGGERADS